MTGSPSDADDNAAQWWATSIIDMKPGEIRYRGYPIEDLIGAIGFAEMIWLMLRGDVPTKGEARLLEAALMAAVDHGPQAPSIAIARMTATCGVGLNNAMASGLNALGDVHGGAGEQAVELYTAIAQLHDEGTALEQAIDRHLDAFQAEGGTHVPGFGHRFHPIDPRAPRLLALVDAAAQAGTVSGAYAAIARGVERALAGRKGKPIPMNIDGATAVIYAELGFAAPLARGLFCLSRSVGILSHAWEEMGQGARNKGPLPRTVLPAYTGHPPRPFLRRDADR